MNRTGAVTPKPLGPLSLALVAVLVGGVAGLGAILFRGLIAFFHNLLFLGKLSLAYDATIHTPPSPWGPLLAGVLAVVAFELPFLIGAVMSLIGAWIVFRYVPESVQREKAWVSQLKEQESPVDGD
jgi:hypothetical protein